jgi:hypothetical protein
MGPPPTALAPPIEPAHVAATLSGFDFNEHVSKYRQLRDMKATIAARHKEELAPYNEALDALELAMLNALTASGQESTRTASGTAYKSTKSSYTVQDASAFRTWLEVNDRWDLLETRVSKEALESFATEGGTLPPGIGVSSVVTVNVRK